MTTGATMFSGGGVGEALLGGLVDMRWAIEYDPAIADVYRRNYGDHVIVGDVRAVDYTALPRVDWLHASPVCTRASVANSGASESDEDMQTALAVVRALEAVQPRAFTLENVWPYRDFAAFRRICRALDEDGYWYEFSHLNAADFGVPQTRRRLILRATRDRLPPTLPEPVRWVGWYEAIEDLIPTLPETKFAPWQMKRLEAHGMETVLIGGGNRSQSFLDFAIENRPTIPAVFGRGEPSFSVTSTASSDARAFLVPGGNTYAPVLDGEAPSVKLGASSSTHGQHKALLVHGGNAGREITTRLESEPSHTVGAGPQDGAHRAWLAAGRVVKITPRALARFQSLPDSYWLPERASLATKVIGNGVPALLMRRVVEQLV